MFSYNGEPLKIVVETVPHETVARLDAKDKALDARIDALHNQLYQLMTMVNEVQRDHRRIEKYIK